MAGIYRQAAGRLLMVIRNKLFKNGNDQSSLAVSLILKDILGVISACGCFGSVYHDNGSSSLHRWPLLQALSLSPVCFSPPTFSSLTATD